jgi:hypothetical protein
MARYYFHVSNAGNLVHDDFGEEFVREEDARTYAARVVSELTRNQPDQSTDDRHLIVMDETGQVVCNVPLAADGLDRSQHRLSR